MTIDERIEALTQSVELMARMQMRASEEAEERSVRLEERLLEAAERNDEYQERASAAHEQHRREMREIRRELARAIRLSIEEQRQERARRQELAKQQIAAEARAIQRHEELETLFKAFLERGGNGKH